MAVQITPFDPGNALQAGYNLLPNLARQMQDQQQLDTQQQQVDVQRQVFQAKQAEEQRELATESEYAADIAAIQGLPQDQQPQATIALMRKYPKKSEALKRSWDSQDEALKQANFQSASEMWNLLKNGAPDKAAALLRKRIEADRAAGQDVADDEAILSDIESGDPERVKSAFRDFSFLMQVAAGPDKFASIAGVVNPGGTEFEKQYEYIKATFGQKAADNFARNKYDPFVESNNKYGTTFYRSSDLAGGGPAPSQGETGGGGDTGGRAATEDEAAAILGGAMRTKFITAEDFARIEASLGPNGKERAQAWLRNQKVQIGKVVGGKRYVQRGKDWFEVN